MSGEERGGEPRRVATIAATVLRAMAERAAEQAKAADRAAYARVIARARQLDTASPMRGDELCKALEDEFLK